jgi:hypothetical protein
MRAIIFAGLIVVTEAGAQIAPAPVRQWPYAVNRWNTDAGLPQNSVNAIIQARDGHLWLATTCLATKRVAGQMIGDVTSWFRNPAIIGFSWRNARRVMLPSRGINLRVVSCPQR